MELSALKSELAASDYIGKTDVEILSILNTKTVVVDRRVPCHEVKRHAMENGYWGAIVIAADNAVLPDNVRGLAISARDWVDDSSGDIESVDFYSAVATNMIAGLVAAGLMTQSQADGLIALRTTTKLWRDHHGFGEIGPGLLNSARLS